MTVIEIETFRPIERDKTPPILGLVEPCRADEYIAPVESDEQLLEITDGFDNLYQRTMEENGFGIVVFHGQKLLLDRYVESGNIIRSILVPKLSDTSDNVLRTVLSLIEPLEGPLLGEIHHSEHVSDRGITEPPVGGRDVLPFDAEDTKAFALISMEASPYNRRSKPNVFCSRHLLSTLGVNQNNTIHEN